MAIWRRGFAAGLFLLLVLPLVRSEEAPSEPPAQKPTPTAGDVFLLVDQLTDALKMLPRAVLLSPEKYAEQLAEIDRLRKQLKTDVPMKPSECNLKGKLEAGRVALTAEFTLVPERPGSVWLACGKKTHIVKCTLDGKPAPVRSEADGLYVHLAAPGVAQLVVDLIVPIQPKGNARFFELELPRAAITYLKELELPQGLKDLRVGEVPLPETLTLKNNRLSGSLGSPERFQLSWREPQAVTGPMLLSAESTIEATVDEKQQLTTTATMNLQVKSGQTSSWRLLLPPGAEVKVPAEFESRIAGIDTTDPSPYASQRTIQLKDPTSETLTVFVRVPPRGALPKGGRLAVGPFAVLGAVRQTGTILVRSGARDVQPLLTPAAECTPRAVTADELKLAPFVRGFKYERVPLPEKVKTATGPGSYALLDLEIESVRGSIETRASHIVRLPRRNVDPEAARPWEVVTTLKSRLVQPGVEWLEVQLPPESQYVPAQTNPPRPVQEVKHDGPRNVLQFRLDRDGWKEFTLSFKVRYDASAGPTGEVVLPLPRPLETERAGEYPVEVIVPEDVELILPDKPNPTLELVRQIPQEQLWQADPTADRLQEQIALAWRPYRPEIHAFSLVDLTLGPREGRIRHEIRLRQARLAPRTLTLNIPPRVSASLRVAQGGKLLRPEGIIQLDGTADMEPVVVLEYGFPLAEDTHPGRGRVPFTVPLIVPGQATTSETRVRVWSDPGLTPLFVGPEEDWRELPLEEVPGIRRLPVLVLRADDLETAVSLRFTEVPGELAPALARRALIRVQVQENLSQVYSTSYLLQQTNGRTLDVKLPAALSALSGLQFKLDGNLIDPEVVEETVARLRLPTEAMTRATLLDISYTLLPRTSSPFATLLQPPVVRGDPGRLLVRWVIVLPGGAVAIGPEEGPGTRRTWMRRGVLLVSRPGEAPAELETWLTGTDAPAREPDAAFANPALVCWRYSVQPLTIYQVPQQIWLLACSLVLLAVGLVLVFWWRRVLRDQSSPAALLVAVVTLALVPILLSLWFPTTLAAVTLGAEPGAVVLLLVVLLQWWAHERERRRLVFLPSFSRKRSPSTVSRPQNAALPRTEPSTVDASPEQ